MDMFYQRLQKIERLRMDFVSGKDIPVCGIEFDDAAKALAEYYESIEDKINNDLQVLLY